MSRRRETGRRTLAPFLTGIGAAVLVVVLILVALLIWLSSLGFRFPPP